MAKICHENLRLLYVLTLNSNELIVMGVNFGGLRGSRIHYLYYRRLSKEDEKWICNDEVATISHLGDCHSVIT